jgi:hypothetical protein
MSFCQYAVPLRPVMPGWPEPVWAVFGMWQSVHSCATSAWLYTPFASAWAGTSAACVEWHEPQSAALSDALARSWRGFSVFRCGSWHVEQVRSSVAFL